MFKKNVFGGEFRVVLITMYCYQPITYMYVYFFISFWVCDFFINNLCVKILKHWI